MDEDRLFGEGEGDNPGLSTDNDNQEPNSTLEPTDVNVGEGEGQDQDQADAVALEDFLKSEDGDWFKNLKLKVGDKVISGENLIRNASKLSEADKRLLEAEMLRRQALTGGGYPPTPGLESVDRLVDKFDQFIDLQTKKGNETVSLQKKIDAITKDESLSEEARAVKLQELLVAEIESAKKQASQAPMAFKQELDRIRYQQEIQRKEDLLARQYEVEFAAQEKEVRKLYPHFNNTTIGILYDLQERHTNEVRHKVEALVAQGRVAPTQAELVFQQNLKPLTAFAEVFEQARQQTGQKRAETLKNKKQRGAGSGSRRPGSAPKAPGLEDGIEAMAAFVSESP